MVQLEDDNMLDDIEVSSEESGDEEIGDDEKNLTHKKLLKDLDRNLGHAKKREFSTSRTEPSEEISEYTWSSNKDKVSLQDLVGSLDSTCKSVAKVKKKLQKMQNKTKVLEKPLEKVQRERVERSVAFEETSKDISKWHSTIQKNREAEQLTFPLNDYKPPPISTKNMVLEFKPQNEMEREISEVLHGSKHLLERKNKELTEAEEKALEAVDLEEALERRKELQRTRALQSYYEAKCHRVKKIKSKKYHRMLKKEQQKALSKIDLETLAKENPELFQFEMEKAEQLRAKERANLRHRNTSKWAKNLIVKGNKSKEDQEHIREQLRISRELTEHKKVEESDEEEEQEKDTDEKESTVELSLLTKTNNAEENPWLLDSKNTENNTDSATVDSSKEYIKLQPVKNKEEIPGTENVEDKSFPEDEWDEAGKEITATTEGKKKKRVKRSKKKKDESKILPETNGIETSNRSIDQDENTSAPANKLKRIQESMKTVNAVKEVFHLNSESSKTEPSTKINKKEKILELCEDEKSDDEEMTFDNTEQVMNIMEAFANDDVMGDFILEKKDVIEKSQPKPVDLTLPGWGDWAGPGLSVSKKKRKRFTKDVGPAPKRKDEGLSNVIINEKSNEVFAKHQVPGVPFPYTNKVEFERSIRQPIGGHWNTPSVHNKLIEQRVRIKPGVTIDPIKASKKMKKKFKQEAAVK